MREDLAELHMLGDKEANKEFDYKNKKRKKENHIF